MTDGIEILIQDHRSIASLLDRVEGQDQPDRQVTEQIIAELSVHDAIERAHLYPLLAGRLEPGKALTDRSIKEHGRVARVLAEIDRRGSDDPYRRELMDSLIKLVRRHVDEEEAQAFLALRARMAPEELDQLGNTLQTAKAKAPTRAHPHSPGSGLGARLGALVLSPIDRARDGLRGRRGRHPPASRPAARGDKTANIYKVLSRRHREIERLVDRLQAPPARETFDDTARRHLVDYLVIAESRHEAAEEMVFWPAVRKRVAEGPILAEEGLRQEREGKYILDTLRVSPVDEAWWELIEEFAQSTRDHIAFEEDQVWPALRKTTWRLGAALIGVKYSWAERVSPTRPHPHGPDRPTGLFTAGMAATLIDRFRDKLTGRPH